MTTEPGFPQQDSLFSRLRETQKQSRIWTVVRITSLTGLGLIAMLQQDTRFYATIYWTVLVVYELMYALGQKEMLGQVTELVLPDEPENRQN